MLFFYWVHRRALAPLIALILTCCAMAQPTAGPYREVRALPDGAMGERIEALLAAIAGGDADEMARFVTAHFTKAFLAQFPTEEHVSILMGVHRAHRALEFYGIRQYEESLPADPGETVQVVIAKSALTGQWRGLICEFEDKPAHRINGLMIAPARPPADLPPEPKIDDAGLKRELTAFVAKLAASEAFSGAALVARGDEILYRDAAGLASRRFEAANRTDTKFNLGSMNKMFTAVAIAQLVERGKLRYEDTIDAWVDESWLPKDVTQRIQVRHLLSHTSGLGSYFTDDFFNASRTRYRVIEDFKPLVSSDRPAFEPGAQWQYSNTGFLLLGVVIQAASGQSYYDYVQERIHRPAGMKNTGCYDMDEPVPNLAIGYTRGHGADGGWKNNLFLHSIKGGPAGGGFSTVEDLHRFARALLSGKLISAESLRTLTTAKPEIGSPNYGYGFSVRGSDDDRVVGHTGGFPGINSALDIYLDRGLIIAAMANDDEGAMQVRDRARSLLDRLEPKGKAESSR